jgi:predicted Zn-dependent protease
MSRRALLCASPLLAGLLVAAGCAVNPATGKRQLSLVSEAQEIEMGRKADRLIEAQMGLYGGAALQDYVQSIGDRLAAVSERPDLDWTFRVVDDSSVNAFALPGGYIYITRGIIAHLNSEAELATVIGHEIGHVTARHSVNQMSKAQLAQLGLGLGMVLSPEAAQQFGGYAEMGVGVMFLKFGRDDERQADDLGLRYMVAADYDARPAPQVFDVLGRVSGSSGADRLPGWLSTHPAPENREADLKRKIASLEHDFGGSKLGRQEYLAHIDGIVFGADPRDGYFKESRFYHPKMAFRFDFPEGWTRFNGRAAVIAKNPQADAIVRVTISSERTPSQALERFFEQHDFRAGASWRADVNGYSVSSQWFAVETSKGPGRGLVAYLRHDDDVYEVLGFAIESRWETDGGALERSVASFDRLNDPAALSVEPARLRIVEPPSAMTLARFADRYDATVPVETLSLINNVEDSSSLLAGYPYKIVQGGRLP